MTNTTAFREYLELLEHCTLRTLDKIADAPADEQQQMQVNATLRSLRRYIEFTLGERDDYGEPIPNQKAPTFCRMECSGNGPDCGGCDHGGYGTDEFQETAKTDLIKLERRLAAYQKALDRVCDQQGIPSREF